MNLDKALRRDVEISKRKHGHTEDGRGAFLSEYEIKKRAEKAKKELAKKKKEKLLRQESSIDDLLHMP